MAIASFERAQQMIRAFTEISAKAAKLKCDICRLQGGPGKTGNNVNQGGKDRGADNKSRQ